MAEIQKLGHKYPWIKLLGLTAGRGHQSTQVPHGLFFLPFWSCEDENSEIFKSLSLWTKKADNSVFLIFMVS